MLVIIAYDIEETDNDGKKRLRNISKICESYGQRVQNSLFECYIDWDHYLQAKMKIEKEIDIERDSVRFYLLGNNYKNKAICIGKNNKNDLNTDILIF